MLGSKRVFCLIILVLGFFAIWFANRQIADEISTASVPQETQTAPDSRPYESVATPPSSERTPEESEFAPAETPVSGLEPPRPEVEMIPVEEPAVAVAESTPPPEPQVEPEEPNVTASVTGRVFKYTDGESVANAEVKLIMYTQDGPTTKSATTDEDGKYTIRDIQEGRYTVTVGKRPGNEHLSLPNNLPTFSVTSASKSERKLDIQLNEGGVMTGLALLGGNPLRNTNIRFSEFSAGQSIDIPETTTDSEGRYRIEGLGEFTGSLVPRRTTENGNSQAALAVPVEIRPNEETEITIDFTSGSASIEGTIYYENTQRPIPARIAIYFGWMIDGEWIEEIINVRTDQSGNFLAENLPAGNAEMHISPENVGRGIERIESVVLADGERATRDVIITSAAVVADIYNIPSGTKELYLLAHPGETIVSIDNMANFSRLRDTMVGLSQNWPGSNKSYTATLEGLMPGRYTITVSAWPATYSLATVQAYGYENLFRDIRSVSTFITVTDSDTEIKVSLELPPK